MSIKSTTVSVAITYRGINPHNNEMVDLKENKNTEKNMLKFKQKSIKNNFRDKRVINMDEEIKTLEKEMLLERKRVSELQLEER